MDVSNILSNVDEKSTPMRILAAIVIVCKLHCVFFPFYYMFIYYFGNDQFEDELSEQYSFEMVIFILLICTFVLYIVVGYLSVWYMVPLYYKLCFVIPIDRLAQPKLGYLGLHDSGDEYYKIIHHFRNETIENMQQLFKNILLHCKALELRPIKEKVVIEYFGHDIGTIVNEYLPVYDYKRGVDDD